MSFRFITTDELGASLMAILRNIFHGTLDPNKIGTGEYLGRQQVVKNGQNISADMFHFDFPVRSGADTGDPKTLLLISPKLRSNITSRLITILKSKEKTCVVFSVDEATALANFYPQIIVVDPDRYFTSTDLGDNLGVWKHNGAPDGFFTNFGLEELGVGGKDIVDTLKAIMAK